MPETLSSSRHKNFSRALVDLALSRKLGGRRAEPFLRESTELIGRTISAERTSVWLFTNKGKVLHCVDLFERSPSRHSKGAELAMLDYPTYFSSLRKRRAIAAHDANRDPRTREFSESYLMPLKITSMLDAPIRSGGKMIGLLCIEHTGPRRRWSTQEQNFAASAADLIALNFEYAERQRAVAELGRSEERYRALAENFPHGAVLMFDRDLRYVVAHGSSLADSKLQIGSLVGRTIFEALSPEMCAILEPHYRKALAGTPSAFEISVGKRVFEVHTVPVRSLARRVTFAMAMAHDITDHVRAEEEIRKSHRLLNDAQAIASLGVFEWRARENRVTWSDSLHIIFGSTPGETALTLDSYLERVHPEDRERVRDGIYQAVSNGSTFAQEERIVRKDGSIRILATKGTAVTDAGGRVTGLVGICQDITDIKEAHRLLSEYNRTLEEQVADRTRELHERQIQLVQSAKMVSLGNLVAGVAHEINSPLGAMLANWDIIRYAATELRVLAAGNTNILSLLDTILDAEGIGTSAGRRINGIISGLRNFARLDQAIEDETDLHDLIESTLPLVGHLMKNRIEVRREYTKLPRVRCYPAKLNQVWMNLLVNAAQAIDGPGEIRIQTYTSNSHAVVAISDSGAGIPPESRARIFDPGFTTKGVKVGMGLGLAIVHGIIEEHRGTIEVESEVGRGSTFRVSLPIDSVAAKLLAARSAAGSLESGHGNFSGF